MTSSLPSVGSLLRDTWSQFKASWSESTKVSMWFLYLSLVRFGLAMLQKFDPGLRTYFFPLDIALMVIGIWVGIRLLQAMLAIEAGKKIDLSMEAHKGAWKFFWPMIWVGLLQVVIILAGCLLFLLPGIYFAFSFSFTEYTILTQDKRGFSALAASYELVKGRWWSSAWRIFAGNFVIGFAMLLSFMLVLLIIGKLAGPAQFFGSLSSPTPDPLVTGVMELLQGLLLAITLPLSTLFNVKLYRALEKTR